MSEALVRKLKAEGKAVERGILKDRARQTWTAYREMERRAADVRLVSTIRGSAEEAARSLAGQIVGLIDTLERAGVNAPWTNAQLKQLAEKYGILMLK